MLDLSASPAEEMVLRLKAISHYCVTGNVEETKKHMVPVTRLSNEDLASTNFCERPVHTGEYALPCVTPDGEPIQWRHEWCLVEVFSDGTAIARCRRWKYDYCYEHELKASLDAKPIRKDAGNTMEVQFYLLGCKHKYREGTSEEARDRNVTLFRCCHLHICDECGHWFVVDSSD